MNELPKQLPHCLTVEKPAANLAALAVSDSLERLSSELIHQWKLRSKFRPVRQYGIRPLDRALFYGPPGNGKTMSAQLVAAQLNCPLYRVQCESLLASEFGQTQKNLRSVMDWLAQQDLAVVLWDECETIFPSRSDTRGDACSQTIVSTMQQFWQRLDRWESPQLFLLATNMLERLDPALLSRCELQIEFGPPTAAQAAQVLEYWCEVFHDYQPETWGARIGQQIEDGRLPASFRALWQEISAAVRSVIATE